MNVALLTSARAWRGSGTSFANIARGLAARGHTVHLLATTPALTAGFVAQGLEARELPIHHTGLREARVLWHALRDLGVEVLVAEKPRDLRLGALVSLVRPIALVYRHNVGQATPPRDLTIRLAYRRVALSIFLTHAAEQQARAVARFMTRPPHRVIYEGVDADRFRPNEAGGLAFRRRQGLADRAFLLAVGALEREKRYHWMLDALAGLGPPAPPLVVCGEGGFAGRIRDHAARLRLDVRLLGFVPPDELAGAYNAATCVVHACAVETFGLALAEAMSSGAPIVAVSGGALREVVGDAAVLVADDPEAFRLAVAELLADPMRRRALGNAARHRVSELLSLERMGREYADALEAVAPPRPGPLS